ncbi:hypothetical protein ANANG_G00142180 [Anguilla anguilla]|uniref:Uncharacterized protein n=1 Tax=Anguilla anguilla TaxID=7936 RepID=A0A9D3RW20_ANGAN|nr:hypothetical protein ANANG_G00142180 [Anguilla anguilla]
MLDFMARTDTDGLQCSRNSKLDTFLRRNTERSVYERIRAYEPCVVISETVNKVFMYVVLSDDTVYLAEYPPRTIRQAVSFRDVLDIELVNDLPDFLSGRDRELSQHIRVVYATAKHDGKKGGEKAGPRPRPSASPSPFHHSNRSVSPSSLQGLSSVLLSTQSAPSESVRWSAAPSSLRSSREEEEGEYTLKQTRRGSVLSRLMRRVLVEKGGAEREETEAELHLYAVSVTSRIYLHLLSSWNSYMIRSTLMLDPLYRKRCSLNSSSLSQKQCQISSWERTACLFRQLSGELLQEGIGLESLYLLLQELHTAAHRNITVRKLFWRSSDLCPFLVKTLEEALKRFLDPANGDSRAQRADRLLLCTLVAETLSLMMREMEVEPARDHMLTAKRGALTEKLLLALVCDPEVVLQAPVGVEESGQTSVHAELQGLMGEYLDAAVMNGPLLLTPAEGGGAVPAGKLYPKFWTHTDSCHLTRQVISVLSGSQAVLSPAQSVLLYQRCRILMACLQHSTDLAQYIRTEFGEEFRYYVTMSWVEEKLPPQYPISQSTLRLISQLQHLVLREP